jgi:hypothetical protein
MPFPRPIDDFTAQCHFSVEHRRVPFTPLGSNRQSTAKGSTRCRARNPPSSPDQEATLLMPSMPLLEANNRTSRQGNRIPPQKRPQPITNPLASPIVRRRPKRTPSPTKASPTSKSKSWKSWTNTPSPTTSSKTSESKLWQSSTSTPSCSSRSSFSPR